MTVATAEPRPAAGRLAARAAAALEPIRLPAPVWLYLFTVVVPFGFSVGPLAMTTLRLLLILMVVPLMLRILAGAYGRVLPTDWLFLGHVLWAAVALGVNNPAQVVQQVGSVGIEFLGGYAMGRAYITSWARFAALCRTLVLIVLGLLPFALLETQTGHSPLLRLLDAVPVVNVPRILNTDARFGLERVQSVFQHPIHFGLFCAVTFSLAFVGMKGATRDGWRWVSSGLVALAGFTALSSGAWLAILLQFGLILWAAMLAGVKQRWWILVGLFVLAYVAIDLLSNRTPIRVFMTYATFNAHTAYWRGIIFEWGIANVLGSAEKGIVGSPWVGIGLNDWVRPSYVNSPSVDNFWLLMAMRYGLPGFLLLAAGWLFALARIIRRDLAADPRLAQARLAWVFTFMGLTFTLCTVHVWSNIYSFTFFIFGAGLWLIYTEPAAPSEALPAPEAAARSGPRFARPAPRGTDPGPRPLPQPEAGATGTTGGGPRFSRFAPSGRTPPGGRDR